MEMELLTHNGIERHDHLQQQLESTHKPFIQANTIASSLDEIQNNHIIPVFIKDNEPLISHADFIEITHEIVSELYQSETILKPSVRLSHPIKGRVPDAKLKPANQLLEHEKTLYYERMAFLIEIPTIHDDIDGNQLSLTVGGVKSYTLDNLYNKKGSDEHFKIFIGFQNKVCTNLCVSSDGFQSDLKVKNIGQLKGSIRTLVENYNASYHIHFLSQLTNYFLTEQQFAQLIGRCRMFCHVPVAMKKNIQELRFGDNQINSICKDYYSDGSFCKMDNGDISLWKLYNLFTNANKSTYIDSFLDRSVNATSFVEELKRGLNNEAYTWFLQ